MPLPINTAGHLTDSYLMATKKPLTFLFGALLLLSACGSSDLDSQTAIDPTATEGVSTVVEVVSDDPESLPVTGDVVSQDVDGDLGSGSPDQDSTTTTTEAPVATCATPAQSHFVDVAIDDPDGGLNMRSGPGPSNSIVNTFAPGEELLTTGACAFVGATQWWQVATTDGAEIGWVSSSFLSDTEIVSPVLGARIDDPDLDGLASESAEATVELLADRYGFDDDRVITFIEGGAADSQGGSVIYEVTGLKDDAISGYRFEIDFFFVRSGEQADQIDGIDPFGVAVRAICNRGITPDGLCI